MIPRHYEQVALKRDALEDGLRTGDAATLVDLAPGKAGEPDGAILEVFLHRGRIDRGPDCAPARRRAVA